MDIDENYEKLKKFWKRINKFVFSKTLINKHIE